jgi:hypothetical protein
MEGKFSSTSTSIGSVGKYMGLEWAEGQEVGNISFLFLVSLSTHCIFLPKIEQTKIVNKSGFCR